LAADSPAAEDWQIRQSRVPFADVVTATDRVSPGERVLLHVSDAEPEAVEVSAQQVRHHAASLDQLFQVVK